MHKMEFYNQVKGLLCQAGLIPFNEESYNSLIAIFLKMYDEFKEIEGDKGIL